MGARVTRAADRPGELDQVAHGHQDRVAVPLAQVVAVVADEVADPGRWLAVSGGGVPGGDQVDLARSGADPVPVAQHGPSWGCPGTGQQVPGPRVAMDH